MSSELRTNRPFRPCFIFTDVQTVMTKGTDELQAQQELRASCTIISVRCHLALLLLFACSFPHTNLPSLV